MGEIAKEIDQKRMLAALHKRMETEANDRYNELLASHERLESALDKIAGLAPGYGDVCESIARIARDALAQIPKGE